MTDLTGSIASSPLTGTLVDESLKGGLISPHNLPDAYRGNPQVNVEATLGPVELRSALSIAALKLFRTSGSGPILELNEVMNFLTAAVPTAKGHLGMDLTSGRPTFFDGTTLRKVAHTDELGTGAGDVTGPAAATDNALVRFDTATGKLIQNSLAILTDAGNLSGLVNITLSGTVDGVDIAALQSDVDGFPDALKNLTTAEINQLENIDTTTISIAQWAILGGLAASLTATELNFVDGVTSSIQTQLNDKQQLDSDLTALAGLSTTGLIVRSGAGAAVTRSLTAGANITITNADGVAANPSIALSSTYPGQTSIVTLGTITSGTWNATAIGPTFGGTGQTTVTVGDILIGDPVNIWAKLPIGSTNQVLTVIAGKPAWVAGVSQNLNQVLGVGNTTGGLQILVDAGSIKLRDSQELRFGSGTGLLGDFILKYDAASDDLQFIMPSNTTAAVDFISNRSGKVSQMFGVTESVSGGFIQFFQGTSAGSQFAPVFFFRAIGGIRSIVVSEVNLDPGDGTPTMEFRARTTAGAAIVTRPLFSFTNNFSLVALQINANLSTLFANGSAGTPAISFIADPDTGMFRPAANQIGWATGGSQRMLLITGLQLGSPTGGDKGVGSINVSADVFKNNSAYTNPDYVFEHWATGEINEFAKSPGAKDYDGLLPIADLENHVRENWRFPMISEKPAPIFDRSDTVLRGLEESYLYLFQHEERLNKLHKLERLTDEQIDKLIGLLENA